MKSIFLKTIALSLVVLSLWSCKKDQDQITADVSPAGTLTASATAVNLSIENANKTAVDFTFPAPTVTGYQVPVTSTLQFDLKGNNFATAKEVVVESATYSTTVADLNKMLLSLGAKIGSATELEVRLRSGAAVNAMTYSNVITLTGTPYLASSWMYVVGDFNNWLFESADSLVSLTGNGIYTGIISFPKEKLAFKVAPAKSWDLAYGAGDGDAISSDGGAGNLTAPAAGLQQVTVDMNTNTFKIDPVLSWAIIGDATAGGWDADTDMKFVNDGKGSWKVTTDLKKGELKFRQDHKWDYAFGLDKDGKFTSVDASNIPVAAAGNYTITFNLEEKTYSLIKN